jgi:hypothetical protein
MIIIYVKMSSANEVVNEYFQDPIYGETYPMTECTVVDGKFKFYFNSLWDWFNDIKKFTNPITNLDFSKENIIAFVFKARDNNMEKTKLPDSLVELFLSEPENYFNYCLNPNDYLIKIIKDEQKPVSKNAYKLGNNSKLIIPDEMKKTLEQEYLKYKTRYLELKHKYRIGLIILKEKFEMNFILSKVNYSAYYQKLGLKL